ncbi:MAG TPA: hypothetical protein VET89_03935 [Stellaceae bacterium]|nr:hypothetical protein [Stellaceae bacterium]
MRQVRAAAGIAALILLGTAAAVPAAAQTPTAEPPATQAQLDDLLAQTLRDPTNIELTLRYARVATELHDYEAAITALERLLFFNPTLARPRLELGVLYYRLGSYAQARTYLEQAQAAPDVPPDSAALIADYLADIGKRDSVQRFTADVFTGLLSESNANFGPTGSNVLVGGLTIPLPSQFTRKADQSWATSGSMTYSYDLDDQNSTTLDLTGRGFFTRHIRVRDLDLVALESTFGPRTTLATLGFTGFSFHPYGIADWVHLGPDPLYHALGFGLEANQKITPALSVSTIYEMRDQRFYDSALRPTVADLSGVQNAISLQGTYRFGGNQAVTALVGFSDDSTRQPFQDNRQFVATLGYQVAYQAPFDIVRSGASWTTSAYVTKSIYRYGGPDPLIDPNTTRRDDVWRLSAVENMPITNDFGLYLQLQYDRVNSTVINFSYKNFTVLFGPQVHF